MFMKNPQQLATLLNSLFAGQKQWQYTLLRNWQSIFGPLSSYVFLERIDKDILVIGVTQACWLAELYTMTPLIIKAINKTLETPHIKQVRFIRVGKRPTKTIKTLSQIRQDHELKCSPLTPQEQGALEAIKDKELAVVLERFLQRVKAERKS